MDLPIRWRPFRWF